ncbi:MAG: C4-dicarboxylate ABC transporter [Zetaproteobacteria bacterium]|nr:C4-dicarboxylate ABC transporter [Pseudobdellovibrionaceae bacterium]|tara:strand:+ start:1070 stop:2101 length:1032 start_codon:yes stop_codon:yes gene_type:complete
MNQKNIRISLLLFFVLITLPTFLNNLRKEEVNQGEKTYTIRIANPSAPSDASTLGYQKFCDIVQTLSKGKIKVLLFSNAILGSDRAGMEAAQQGLIEVASSSSPNMASFSTSFMALDLPYITERKYQENLYHDLDNGLLGKEFKKIAESINLVPIMFGEYGYRNFASTKRPIKSPQSLINLNIRTTDSPVEIKVAEELKMIPTPIAWGEAYIALQQGAVDGESNTYSLLYNSKHGEVLKYFIESEHNYSLNFLMMNKDYFYSLPQDLQDIVIESGRQAVIYERKLMAEQQKIAREEFIKMGISIYTPMKKEKDYYKKATRRVWEEFSDKIPSRIIQLIQATQT